jgi:hypothetical protein
MNRIKNRMVELKIHFVNLEKEIDSVEGVRITKYAGASFTGITSG